MEASARLLGLLRSEAFRRGIVLVLLSAATALLLVDQLHSPLHAYRLGDVADREIRAPDGMDFVDEVQTASRQREAEKAVALVFDHDATLAHRLTSLISEAFLTARGRYAEAQAQAQAAGQGQVSEEVLAQISRDFVQMLDFSVDAADLERITALRWSQPLEEATTLLVEQSMSAYIVADKAALPPDGGPVSLIRRSRSGVEEALLPSTEEVMDPREARQGVSLLGQEHVEDRQLRLPAISLSRAALRPNFSFNQAGTEERRQEARDGVPQVVNRLSRGAVIAREGDALNAQQIAMIEELRKGASNISLASSLVGLALLSAFVYLSFYLFAASQIERFARRIREIEAVALITLLLLGIGRILLEASGPLAALTGAGVAPSSFWYLVPFASGAMLVRILVNAETALVWILAGAGLMGLLFEQEVLLALFFAISGAAATAAVSQSRERAGVLRAGVLTGLINGICALLMGLVAAQGEEVGATGPALQSLWDVGFAFVGGLLSGVLTLGLVPVFELMGFVTDYKLLELANLNHPLLRQLMLRAPGTYHHSVTVAQLCEAAAEAIGANALQTRVACYFHDIGKAVQPRFFIENQRGGPNPHEKLSPHASARIIIAHVVDGAAIARQYKLPQPIIDGILMHHGTSLVQYFYVKAVNAAGPDGQVDEADFRYPGELPNSRETGIMMLADKVEAACRTLKDKSPASIRALIQKLINGAITEGQLEKCPLTVQELYRIVDAFTEALLAIYHNRIEYPGIQRAPVTEKGEEEQATGPVITLELQNPLAQAHPAVQEAEARARLRLVTPPRTDPGRTDPGEPVAEHDYESAENQMRPGHKGKG